MATSQQRSQGELVSQESASKAGGRQRRGPYVLLAIVLLAVIVAASWELLSNRRSATDPTVPGRPLSNPETHLHTLVVGDGGRSLYLGTHFGLFMSHDGGKSWPQPRGALAPAMVTSIALAPGDPSVLAVIAVPSGIGSEQPGVYMSRDGGQSWRLSNPSHLPSSAYPFSVQAGSGPVGHFYAFFVYAGWYETTDFGAHWRPITSGALSAMQTPLFLTDPVQPHHLLLGGDQGLFETTDDGSRWQRIQGVNGTVLSLTATRTQPRLIFCATDEGLYRWQDGSKQITHLSGPTPNASLTRLVSSADGHVLYALAGRDLWFSSDQGTSWQKRFTFSRSDLMTLQLSPRQPTLLYAAFFYPASVLFSQDGGHSWQVLTD
ncbi:WD40/YVTN/BNR-like repeat-containing protein [Thermogemmatispora carboxidivorans]|uniref:WD40/YVTN/BNR-like repeat-containing protein n=1 Tax=Thermogemmatispora carboxidivorans TaxID=1382306 RepID=UPI00069B00D2|nr:sialidase family protein [Thermogemmatispora carboxidivorans]